MIALTADATDSDGIARVEFYQGSTLLGASTASPYAYTWNNVPAGNYVLTAKAYDSLGASTVSSPVNVTVNPSGGAAVNVAAQANEEIASASSSYSAGYPVAAVNDGDRKEVNWGSGGGCETSSMRGRLGADRLRGHADHR